ncbi:MAG: hypothetical protein LBG20_01125 [Holosporaceae bacterium]|nr:hypothetical protein [Holosporaceae bacterium]
MKKIRYSLVFGVLCFGMASNVDVLGHRQVMIARAAVGLAENKGVGPTKAAAQYRESLPPGVPVHASLEDPKEHFLWLLDCAYFSLLERSDVGDEKLKALTDAIQLCRPGTPLGNLIAALRKGALVPNRDLCTELIAACSAKDVDSLDTLRNTIKAGMPSVKY